MSEELTIKPRLSVKLLYVALFIYSFIMLAIFVKKIVIQTAAAPMLNPYSLFSVLLYCILVVVSLGSLFLKRIEVSKNSVIVYGVFLNKTSIARENIQSTKFVNYFMSEFGGGVSGRKRTLEITTKEKKVAVKYPIL